MPEQFGPWSTVYQRLGGWRNGGAFYQIVKRLHIRLSEQGLIDLGTWMIDSTAVRAARASSGAGKKGAEEPQNHALGRSRGGLTTKIRMLCDANDVLFRFLLPGGQASDIGYVQPFLDEACIPSRGRPRKCCWWLLAYMDYDAEALRQHCDWYRM